MEARLSRRFDDLKLLVIYVDGLVFGKYTMIGAVGVDTEGRKHVLGIRDGATENATVVTELLEDVVARGVDAKRKMLFVIDGSKALRAAINAVFGADQPVQRCGAHKLRNVLSYLPKDQQAQVKSVLRAAWKLPPKDGMARIKKLAVWFDNSYPSAASSLLEGLEECFTINRLDIPPALQRCLATTNVIESPHAGVRIQTRRVNHWQNGKMVLCWMASAFIRTEQRFNKIMGRNLWALEAILNQFSTPLRPPAKRWRSNINRTAARHFQLRTGRALYWMLRTNKAYPEIVRIENSSNVPLLGRCSQTDLSD